MNGKRMLATLGVVMLVLAACGPAATPSPATSPTSTAVPPTPRATSTPVAGPTAQPAARTTPTPTAAAAKPKSGGVLIAVQSGDPPGWDFMKLSGGASLMRMQNNLVFSQLVIVPNTPETACSTATRNELAEEWKWLNDLTLQVRIRPGVKFHNKPPVNGRELTSADVAYSLGRLLKVQARVAAIAPIVASVQPTEPRTVVISLKQPHGGLPYNTLLGTHYGAAMLAKEAGGAQESWDDPTTSYIGTGPFVFREYKGGVKISYTRNPTYWKQGLPYLDGLDWLIVVDRATQAALFRAGRVDVQPYGVGIATVHELRGTAPQIRIQSCPAFAVPMSYLRTDQPPLNDVRVRRAISMAVDRQALLSALLKGEGMISALMPPIDPLYLSPQDIPQSLRRYIEYHPDEAKRLLAEAGYPDGRGLELTVNHTLGRHVRYWEEWTESLIAALGQLGIKAKPNWMEYGAYSRTVLNGDYSGLATTGFVPSDIYAKFSDFLSTSEPAQNRSHVNDPEMDALVRQFIVTTNEVQRKDLAHRIQLRAIEQVYMIVPPANMDYYLSQPWVKGFGPVPFDPFSGSWAEITWLGK